MKRIFFNGTIRTMAEPSVVEAVLTNGERIEHIGDYSQLISLAPDAEQTDLMGKTMLPAFIDAHSHLSSYAMSFLQVSLEKSSCFDEIEQNVRKYISENKIKPGEWVIATGYDHNFLKEKQHPSLKTADTAAKDNPLVLQHASGHAGVFNSKAMHAMGVTPETKAPEGGKIGCSDGRLTGYFEENAFFAYRKKVPLHSAEDMILAYQKAQKGYASHGISTVQEGMTVDEMLPIYQLLLDQKQLKLDVVAYLMPENAKRFMDRYPQAVGAYYCGFKIGGFKIVLDGSPQGRTAWMKTPYQEEEPPYYGYGTMSEDAVASAVKLSLEKRLQLLAHCNGDAAAQQYIDAIKCVQKEAEKKLIRPVMIHAQLLRKDQMEQVNRLNIIPSFFVAHVYYWGDVHIKNFGLRRASEISPAKSALDQNVLFTFHQDTPVIEPDMLETVWCAVNRQTKNGVLLGESERIPVLEALKAVTINAAIQYGEEEEKGSIEEGKRADFVILDHDPVSVDPMEIKEIKVVQMIKNGKEIRLTC